MKYEFCYALTENGDLYRWGGNILKSEIFLQGVDDFYSFDGNWHFLINYKDGHKEAIIKRSSTDRAIVDITDLVSDDEVLYIGQTYIIIRDSDTGISSYAELNIEYGDVIDERHRIYGSCSCTETNRFEIGNNILSVAGIYASNEDGIIIDVLSEAGEHASLLIGNGTATLEKEWGGRGYKYYRRINKGSHKASTFALLGNKVYTCGDNEYGQLGDGTCQDYYDDWLEVDEFNCVELIAQSGHEWGQYCTALDDKNNIWCWGGNFGSSPTIEIPCE